MISLVKILFAATLIVVFPTLVQCFGNSVVGIVSVAPLLSGYLLWTTARDVGTANTATQALGCSYGMIPAALFYFAYYSIRANFSSNGSFIVGGCVWLASALLLKNLL